MRLANGASEARQQLHASPPRSHSSSKSAMFVRPAVRAAIKEKVLDECSAKQGQHAIDEDAARDREPSVGPAFHETIHHRLLHLQCPTT
jgi:hypothetical protein